MNRLASLSGGEVKSSRTKGKAGVPLRNGKCWEEEGSAKLQLSSKRRKGRRN